MKEIRFTLGDSNLWHSIFADFDIINEIQVGQVVANIITTEIAKIKSESGKAKNVIIINEDKKIVAKSSDISDPLDLKIENEHL